MRNIIGFVAVLALAGCGGKKDDKQAASAAAKPGGTAPAAAKANLDIILKTNFPENAGTYDGSKALYLKHYSGETRIAFARDCPTFDCTSVNVLGGIEDAMRTACPKAAAVILTFADQKEPGTGEHKVKVDLPTMAGGTTLTGPDYVAPVTIAEKSADVVKGSIAFTNGEGNGASGAFQAKVCPTP